MKVLLVRPQAPNKLSFTKVLDNEPLELEYLHTALKERCIDDYIFDGLVEYDLPAAIRREKPQVIAITGYITQQNIMLRYCRQAKEYDSSIVTIIGGVHAQLNYKSFYRPEVDFIYRSECVWDFARLIEGIAGGVGDFSHINGLCRRMEGNFLENPLTPIDINTLPIPDRSHYYAHKSYYRYLDLTEVATVKTAFSCPHSCNFCYCTRLNGGRYQARDLSLVIDELAGLDATNVQIVDDEFLVSRERILEFIRLLKERGIKKTYTCYARADFVSQNPDIIKALCEVGFLYFLVGLEAVTDEELDAMNKKTSTEMNRRCVEVIHEAGARPIALMIAPIDADRPYFDRLYHWIVDNNLIYVTVSVFTPIPGTPLYDDYKDKITSTDIEDWDFLHLVLEPSKLSRREFYSEYRKLFLRLYKIASREGIYDFMDLKYYKNMLIDFLKRKIKGV